MEINVIEGPFARQWTVMTKPDKTSCVPFHDVTDFSKHSLYTSIQGGGDYAVVRYI